MQIRENILICKNIKFYDEKDKEAFFEWIKKIDCIDKISSQDNELYLYVCADDIHDYDLRELLGLFYRYKVNMKQLARFSTNNNKYWFFDNKKAYWHKKTFG